MIKWVPHTSYMRRRYKGYGPRRALGAFNLAPLQWKSHQLADATVFVLIGELDLDVAATVAAQLDAAAERKQHLIVDLRDLRFIDSSGIKTLVDAHRLITRAKRKFALVIASPPIQHIFRIVGVDQILPVFSTLEAAVENVTQTA